MTNAIPVHNIDDTIPAINRPTLHVASLIVHVRPAMLAELRLWIEQQPRVDIYSQSDEGKLALVMESDDEHAILNLIDAVAQQPGVLNAALIYHEMIDAEEEA